MLQKKGSLGNWNVQNPHKLGVFLKVSGAKVICESNPTSSRLHASPVKAELMVDWFKQLIFKICIAESVVPYADICCFYTICHC